MEPMNLSDCLASTNNSAAPYDNVVVVVVFIEMLIGGLGNGLVVAATFTHKQLHNPLNWLIASLAVGDFVYIAVLAPMATLWPKIATFRWFFCADGCTIFCFLVYTVSFSTEFHYLSLSVNRLIAVCRPIAYRRMFSVEGLLINVFLCYATSSILSAWLIWPEGAVYDPIRNACAPLSFGDRYRLIINLTSCCNFTACLVLGLTFLNKFCARRRYLMTVSDVGQIRPALRRAGEELEAVKLIVMPMIVFALTGGIYVIIVNVECSDWFVAMAELLGAVSHFLNTFVYAIFNVMFRQAFKNILRGQVKRLEN